MYNLPGSLYLVTIFVFFQGFLILTVIFLFIDKFFSTRKQRIETAKVKQEAFARAQEELDEARKRSIELINEAEVKSVELVEKSQYLSESMQNELRDAFRRTVVEQSQVLANLVNQFGRELSSEFNREKISTLAGLDSVFTEIKTESLSQLASYKDTLTRNSLETEQQMRKQAEMYLSEMRSKLAEYEKGQFNKIKSSSFSIIARVSKEFFGQTMTLSDHESLVLKLLAEESLREKVGV